MPNSLAMPRSAGSTKAGKRGSGPPARRGRRLAARARQQDGFMLVEVLMSALLVALIVIGTLTGFDAASRVSADQRRHTEAGVLAAQSQEQLRSDPAATLVALEYASHSFTKTVGGTIFTITQEARAVAANGESTGCSASETKAESGANIQISSTVTWALQKSAARPAVKDSSIITPPVGSSVEIDVTNGGSQKISGVTGRATFIPVESSTPTSVEGVTGAGGCVILTGIAATQATIEIGEKTNYVTPSGRLKWPTKEIKIAPNLTTHYPVTYAEGGRIVAKYTYKGAETWEGKPVRGDTFVVFNSAITEKPGYLVGSPSFEYAESGGEEKYKALTGTFSPQASTATGTRFAKGDLFPFETPKWQVYAGDCPANSPEALSGKGGETLTNPSVKVEPGQPAEVSVPMSHLQLNMYAGTYAGKGTTLETAGSYPVTISDTECASAETPNAAFAASSKHAQVTEGGHLGYPFQPFGKQEFCMVYASGGKSRVFRQTFENNNIAGSTLNIYPNEASKQEREAEEAEAKKARETKEAEEKKARETKEAEEKKARETKESEERTQWKKEETEKKITKKQREEKEAAQTTKRKEAESAEATKRKEAETAEAKKRKEAEASEKTASEKRLSEEASRPYTNETGSTC